MKIAKGFGILVSDEIYHYPGSGSLRNIKNYEQEKKLLDVCLNNIDKKNPVMIELGSFWALWSIIFRKKFPSGTNILIEIFSKNLEIGVKNFLLNEIRERVIPYHGSICRNSSHCFKTKSRDDIGLDLDLYEILEKEKIESVDLLHCDIQGSELEFLKLYEHLLSNKVIKNIIIGTHTHLSDGKEIHHDVVEILNRNNYTIVHNFYNLGSDGYVYAKIDKGV